MSGKSSKATSSAQANQSVLQLALERVRNLNVVLLFKNTPLDEKILDIRKRQC